MSAERPDRPRRHTATTTGGRFVCFECGWKTQHHDGPTLKAADEFRRHWESVHPGLERPTTP